jgi:hypothetical protein
MKAWEYIASLDTDKAQRAGVIPFTTIAHLHVYLYRDGRIRKGSRKPTAETARDFRLSTRQVLSIIKKMEVEL